MNRFRAFLMHFLIVAAGTALLLGIPLERTGAFAFLRGGAPDAVSSASVILDAPDGSFLILINEKLHPDEKALADWIDFFSGEEEELTVIFEDISCSVAEGDADALELAESFQSRLPENQMVIREEEATLLFSRADAGKFDILIVSSAYRAAFKPESAEGEHVFAVEKGGES